MTRTLWQVEGVHDSYSRLLHESDGDFVLINFDGTEGTAIRISTEQLLDLAFTIYEELG